MPIPLSECVRDLAFLVFRTGLKIRRNWRSRDASGRGFPEKPEGGERTFRDHDDTDDLRSSSCRILPSAVGKDRSQGLGRRRREIDELVRYWPVIHNMVTQELKVRYQRSLLGFFWTLLNPILMLTTLSFVFSRLGGGQANYTVYLFAGMVPWTFLSGSIAESAFAFIHNEGLIKKIYIPKIVFPLVRVLINFTTLLFSMTALFLLLIPTGARFTWSIISLPLPLALLAMFTLGLSLLISTLNTFFRDCGHFVTVGLQAWYFATPIIYRADLLPEETRWWLIFNPAYPIIRLFQRILADGLWPDWSATALGSPAP